MLTEQQIKNRKIAIAVLRGYTYAQVGRVFGVTGTTARIHTMAECYRKLGLKWPMWKKEVRSDGRVIDSGKFDFPMSLKEVKQHKNRLIEVLNKDIEVGFDVGGLFS